MKRVAREKDTSMECRFRRSFLFAPCFWEKTAFRGRHIHAGWAQARPTCRHPPRGIPVSNGKREKWGGGPSAAGPVSGSKGKKGGKGAAHRRNDFLRAAFPCPAVPEERRLCGVRLLKDWAQAVACGNRDKRQPSSEGLRWPCPVLRAPYFARRAPEAEGLIGHTSSSCVERALRSGGPERSRSWKSASSF